MVTMTIDEISKTLPNGFHDSDLIAIQVDFEHATATMDFAVDVSDWDIESKVVPRRGRLTLTGLLYFVLEPPYGDQAYEQQTQSISDGSSDFTELANPPKLPKLPEGSFAEWFYSASDNNFLYVAASDAQFDWTE